MTEGSKKCRIGLVGYGALGQYLYEQITLNEEAKNLMDLVFVWNRSKEKLSEIPPSLVIDDLNNFKDKDIDLIVEVAHSSITKQFGPQFIKHADYFVGSPTALADVELKDLLDPNSFKDRYSLYIPVGAL